ncbi:MAG: RDD family protein [Actinomycetes bacterium]
MQTSEKASFGRRFVALTLDWFMAYGVAILLVPAASRTVHNLRLPQLAIFFVEITVLTILTQSSAGQRLIRLRVVDADTGGWVSPLRILVRTLLICLVLPAVFTKEGRGYHEWLTKTTVLRV